VVCTDCGLYIVGSSLNGFGSSMSDMDLCLMVSHVEVSRDVCVFIVVHLLATKSKAQLCHMLCVSGYLVIVHRLYNDGRD